MTKAAAVARDVVFVLALDQGEGSSLRRVYRASRGADAAEWSGHGALPLEAAKVVVLLQPTRTYTEGFGGDEASAMAPEDRAMVRGLKRHYESVSCVTLGPAPVKPAAGSPAPKRAFVAFEWKYLRNAKQILKTCYTRPNRQDYLYLATKTFGINLVVRVAFAVKAALGGQVPVFRAVAVTGWYQIQDIVFTVFGQTYMKFLGKMTGLLRVSRAQLGDFFFVYFQLVGFEFLNRLVLGPIGENPLVYTWQGLSLIFLNILQGLISGGPLTPAINQLRRAGVISHNTLMHLYQLGGLTLQFGLFATFGYQKIYALLTGSVLVLAWSSYLIATFAFPDPELLSAGDVALPASLLQRLADAR